MRRAARVDDNHAEIIRALLAVGATVVDTSAVGAGCPDLLVGYRGVNFLIEIKDGAKPKSARQLTQAQESWFALWRGRAAVVIDVDEALAVVGAAE